MKIYTEEICLLVEYFCYIELFRNETYKNIYLKKNEKYKMNLILKILQRIPQGICTMQFPSNATFSARPAMAQQNKQTSQKI